jgi:RNA polymerase sigma-54 factor
MEIKQQLRQTQQLVMTPQLQQAIKLLQMSRMELVDLVREEMLENPVLEDQVETGEMTDKGVELNSPSEQSVTIDRAEEADHRASEASVKSDEKKTDEIDWERYLENHAMQAPMPSSGRMSDEEMPGVEATLTKREDLADHLAWQIRLTDFTEDELRFVALVVGNLDDNGYLKLETSTGDPMPPEDVVPRLAAEAELNPEDAEEVLKMIQRLDPVGAGSRDLRECLLVQAEHHGMDSLVLDVLRDHLSNLEKKNYAAIARDLKVTVEEIYDVAQVIAELEPRPGRDYVSEEPRYIVPDVYVTKVGDKYYVQANDDGMPRLKISGFYRAAMAGDPKAKEYIQGKLRSAQWLIRSIDQRRKTIVKVTECIVEKQREFFDLGIEYLKPMILRDVAETVGMHESTISRVTSNKYVATPRGVFELKYFFNSAIRRDNAEDIASESVKQAIKKIIGEEDTRNPHSDQKIVEVLAQDGVVIARRTVAKYREMLGILSSSKRKKYF